MAEHSEAAGTYLSVWAVFTTDIGTCGVSAVSNGRGLWRGIYLFIYIYINRYTYLHPTVFRPIANSREYYSPRQERFFSFHHHVSLLIAVSPRTARAAQT